MIETLRRKCVNPEVTWREVFMAFDWSFEADAIKDYVKSMKLISVQQLNDILVSLYDYECKLDLTTVQLYENSVEMSEMVHESDVRFFKFVRENMKRVEKEMKQKFRKYVNYDQDNQRFKLHEGFNKMCGLRGCMLSGGQK